MTTDDIARLKVLGAGILSLVLTMGIARFAYTPLLPVMQHQAGLDVAWGGWLASANYLGYLSGAVIASRIDDLVVKDRLYRLGLLVAVATTAFMGLTADVWAWAVLRYLAGLSSAAGLLVGSGLILNWLIRHDHKSELGIHFSGMGLGIALGAAAVEAMSRRLSWDAQWLALAGLGLVLLLPAWRWLPPPDTTNVTRSGSAMRDDPPGPLFTRLFILAYFCAGIGYVVSATFIVAIIDHLPGLEGRGNLSFLLLGLAAMPACIVWDLVARRLGDLASLAAAYALNTIAILLPVTGGLAPAILGAALFGFSFIGIVSLVLTMAGRYYPTRPAKMMGRMTIGYGISQIIAPAITALIATRSGSYASGLYLAAAAMALGTLIVLRLRRMAHEH